MKMVQLWRHHRFIAAGLAFVLLAVVIWPTPVLHALQFLYGRETEIDVVGGRMRTIHRVAFVTWAGEPSETWFSLSDPQGSRDWRYFSGDTWGSTSSSRYSYFIAQVMPLRSQAVDIKITDTDRQRIGNMLLIAMRTRAERWFELSQTINNAVRNQLTGQAATLDFERFHLDVCDQLPGPWCEQAGTE